MSTKKLIQEISMMTHKGIYPSLNILLEEEEDNKEDSSEVMNDDPFGDKDPETPPPSSPPSKDTEDVEEESDSSEESDELKTSSEPEESDETSTNNLTLNDIKNTLQNINDITMARGQKTNLERQFESFKKNYFNLEKFSLLQEDSSNIVADLQDVLNKFEEKNGFGLDDIKDKVSGGKKINFNHILDQAKEELDKPFDVALSILKDKLELIRNQANVGEIEEAQKKFVDMFEEYCNQKGINITIPEEYKKIKPTNHNVGQGAVKSG